MITTTTTTRELVTTYVNTNAAHGYALVMPSKASNTIVMLDITSSSENELVNALMPFVRYEQTQTRESLRFYLSVKKMRAAGAFVVGTYDEWQDICKQARELVAVGDIPKTPAVGYAAEYFAARHYLGARGALGWEFDQMPYYLAGDVNIPGWGSIQVKTDKGSERADTIRRAGELWNQFAALAENERRTVIDAVIRAERAE